jgi:hypothetical protein
MEPTQERIGLLFVHGVGEQKRWEHLKSSVHEFAELMRGSGGPANITVVDRTDSWQLPPGERHPQGLSPLSLHFSSDERRITFECHEIWWGDLAERSGIFDSVTFWLWGFGQWCAPIYRELDAAGLPKVEQGLNKPVSSLVRLPRSVAGHPLKEPIARVQLLMAALAALFVACTLTLVKRLFAALLRQAPSTTILVQYVGDVRTYESRAAPGDSALSDPGDPRRVGIRRRMVTEMVAMGAREDLDGWYVLGHSLGSVVAYNGLTEIGHALPNYLPRLHWENLPAELKQDPGCCRRDSVHGMMPSRPPWVDRDAVINRPLLFERLRGFLTYGSPLDKFAGLWPRIVATATDRHYLDNPFPAKCRWINFVGPTDPVAGCLDSFAPECFQGALPRVKNVTTPWSLLFGLSHITYFWNAERHRRTKRIEQRRAVTRWLMDQEEPVEGPPLGFLARLLTVHLPWVALVTALGALTALVLALLAQAGEALFGIDLPYKGESLASSWPWAVKLVVAAAVLIPLLSGVYRWAREAWLNVGLAKADRAADPENQPYWDRLVLMLRLLAIGGTGVALLSFAAIIYGAGVDLCCWPAPWPSLRGFTAAAAAGITVPVAILVQTLLNRIVPPARQLRQDQ